MKSFQLKDALKKITMKGFLTRALSIAVTAIVITLVFPIIPGITLNAGPVAVLVIALAEYLLSIVLVVAGAIVLVIGTMLGCLILDVFPQARTSNEVLLALGERLGYYKFIGLVFGVSFLSDVVTLKILGWVLPGVTIAGLLPAICAALALNLASLFPLVFIWDSSKHSKQSFEGGIAKLRAEVEAAKSKAAASATPNFWVEDGPSGGAPRWDLSAADGTGGRVTAADAPSERASTESSVSSDPHAIDSGKDSHRDR